MFPPAWSIEKLSEEIKNQMHIKIVSVCLVCMFVYVWGC